MSLYFNSRMYGISTVPQLSFVVNNLEMFSEFDRSLSLHNNNHSAKTVLILTKGALVAANFDHISGRKSDALLE